ncbi:MAG: cytidylate kinase-like family protein [Candidatus Edwardsbacteria bacterium]|nr:cytidylate kinase-like family protein [Candidatus Edwardsbacteria bacterium]
MPVITISKEHGAGGKQISQDIARALGYELVDKAMIVKVAQNAKVTAEKVEKFDQEGYDSMSKHLNSLLLANPSLYSGLGFEMPMAGPGMLPAGYDFFDAEQYLKFTQSMMDNLCSKGKVVLVGRGSQVFLSDKPDCLHLRLAAPLDYRIKRVMEKQAVGEKEARDLIHKKDRARSSYIKDFYQRDWNDPALYHLIINTARINSQGIIAIINEAIKQI